MASKYMKKCSIFSVIREMQTKTTVRYNCIPNKRLKRPKPPNVKDVAQLELHIQLLVAASTVTHSSNL